MSVRHRCKRVLGLVALIAGCLAWPGRGLAAEPACFPARTVTEPVGLLDDRGEVFGYLRTGQTLRVVADGIGAKGDQAVVIVDGAFGARAVVGRHQLAVFTRRELPIIEGWSWLRRDAPVRLDGGDGKIALATWESFDPSKEQRRTPRSGEATEPGSLTVGCHEFLERSRLELSSADCCGGPSAPQTVAADVRLLKRAVTLTSEDRRHHARVLAGRFVGIIKRAGGRVLVDVDDDGAPVRRRGWLPASALSDVSAGVGCGCAAITRGLGLRPPRDPPQRE